MKYALSAIMIMMVGAITAYGWNAIGGNTELIGQKNSVQAEAGGCGAAITGAALGDPASFAFDLSGISYFDQLSTYLSEIEVANGDGFTVEYFPPTDEYTIFVKKNGKEDIKGHYNGRNGYYQVGQSYGHSEGLDDLQNLKSRFNLNTEELDRLLLGISLIQSQYNVPIPHTRRGYPEVKGAISRITNGQTFNHDEIKPGTIVLYQGTYRDFVLVKWEGFKEFKDGNEASVQCSLSSRLGGYGYIIDGGDFNIKPASSDDKSLVSRESIVILKHNTFGEERIPGKIWKVSNAEAALLSQFKAKFEDIFRGRRDQTVDYLILNSIMGIQYEKWGMREVQTDIDRHFVEAKNVRERYDKMNFAGYSLAIDHLIQRFGPKKFAENVKMFMEMNLMLLHTSIQEKGSPYQPHSDIRPEYGYRYSMVHDTIRGAYPVPMDISEHLLGGYANVVSLFGDVEFWIHMRDNYSDLFTSFTDFYVNLPSKMKITHSYNGSWEINPIGVLKHLFPEAYAVILSEREDFRTKISLEESIKRH